MTDIPIVLVVARAHNGVIGRGGDLPWRLSRDMRRFREITMGKPIVMGRKTHESIGRALPGRTNIVISSDPGFAAPGVQVAPSLDSALELARASAESSGAEEICVIGGAAVYRAALPLATRIYLTEVHMAAAGDIRLDDFPGRDWREVERMDFAAEPGDSADFSFVVLERSDPAT